MSTPHPAPSSAEETPAESTTAVVVHGVVLALACLVTYEVMTDVLTHVGIATVTDDALGGMWAVIATVFVYRWTFTSSTVQALSRLSATLVSFVLCFVYLVFLPFSAWGLAGLIAIGSILTGLLGRPQDAVTTGITTTVVMVVAGLGPAAVGWHQPVLRLLDTVVGMAVGLLAARLVLLGPSMKESGRVPIRS